MEQDPPGTVKQAHSHEGQEFDYVLEGYLKIVLGGQRAATCGPGDSLYYDSSLPHAMYAVEGGLPVHRRGHQRGYQGVMPQPTYP